MSANNDIVPTNTQQAAEPIFKKRFANKKNLKRKAPIKVQSDSDDDDDSDDDVTSEVVTKDRKTVKNPFVQGTRKRRVKKCSDDEDEEDSVSVQYTADRSTTSKE